MPWVVQWTANRHSLPALHASSLISPRHTPVAQASPALTSAACTSSSLLSHSARAMSASRAHRQAACRVSEPGSGEV